MENYFEKYATEVRELRSRINELQQEVNALRSSGSANSELWNQSFGRSYFAMNKLLLKRIGKLAVSPGAYFSLIVGVVSFPVRAGIYAGTQFNRKVAKPYLLYYLSLYAHELKVRASRIFTQIRRDKPVRVGIFIPTLGALAGAERYAIRLASSIAKSIPGSQVELIATNILSDTPTLYDVPTREEIESKFNIDMSGIGIRYVLMPYNDLYSVWHKNFFEIASISRQYSLFVNCQQNLYASRAKRNLFLCHFPHRPLSEVKPDIPRRRRSQITRLFSRGYDMYVSNSQFTANWLNRYWPAISLERIRVLHPPVLPLAARLQTIPPKEKMILTCGRIDPEKKLAELAEIFISCKEQLNGHVLVIVGTTYTEDPVLKAYYERLISYTRRHKEIKIVENASFEELMELYRRASIYWHGMGFQEDANKDPIRVEHFGISIVEAMSQGCIPLVHSSGGAAGIIAAAGLDSEWTTADDAVEQLILLTKNQNLDKVRRKAVNASLEYSEERFDEQLRDLLRSQKVATG